MKNIKLHSICLCLLICCPLLAFAQNSECEIYKLMSPYLKDTTKSSSSHLCYYVWTEKKEFKKGHLKYLKEEIVPDSLLMWDDLIPIATESKKISKCKLDIGYAYKFTNSEKVWSKIYSGGVMLVIFSKILYYKDKQAFAFVELKCCTNVTMTYYFFFERENEKWKIRRVVDFFRV